MLLPSLQTVADSETFFVEVWVDTNAPLGAISLEFPHGMDVVVDAVTAGDSVEFGNPLTINNDPGGTLTFNDVQAESLTAPMGNFKLATIQGRAFGAGGDSYPLNLAVNVSADTDGGIMATTAGDATVQIATPTPTPTPSPTPTPTAAALTMSPTELLIHHPPQSAAIDHGTGTVNVDVHYADDLGAIEFTMSYMGGAVFIANATDVTVGSFLGSTGNNVSPVGPDLYPSLEEMVYGVFSFGANPGASGGGTLASVIFSSTPVTGRTEVPLDLHDIQLSDTDGNLLLSEFTVPATVTVCFYADLDCDDDVDIVDIQQVAGLWNSQQGDGEYDRLKDVDKDGDIDIIDIQQVAGRWNTSAPFTP